MRLSVTGPAMEELVSVQLSSCLFTNCLPGANDLLAGLATFKGVRLLTRLGNSNGSPDKGRNDQCQCQLHSDGEGSWC